LEKGEIRNLFLNIFLLFFRFLRH